MTNINLTSSSPKNLLAGDADAKAALSWWQVLQKRELWVIFLLGFASGLPLALVWGTMQAWFKVENIGIVIIGSLSLIRQPYAFKLFWAPLFDRFHLPLGRRKGWILLLQILIILTLLGMAQLSPARNMGLCIACAALLAIFSASQDIVIDAYRVERLDEATRLLGASIAVEGYRFGMLASGAGGLLLAGYIGFAHTYLIMALLMLPILLVTWHAYEKPIQLKEHSLISTYLLALKEFFARPQAVIILWLVLFYKFGDVAGGALTTTFMQELGFSLQSIGIMQKVFGTIATMIGIFFGGLFLNKIGLYRALLISAFLQGITNVLYIALSYIDGNYYLASLIVSLESLTGGMGTAALVALLTTLCRIEYTATQYALLSAVMSLTPTYFGPIAGILVKCFGWHIYYTITVFCALPAVMLILTLRPRLVAPNLSLQPTT